MQITREFVPHTDRYAFDFKLCTTAKGWAQIDTSQDASYYGQWISPAERKIVSYAEGDLAVTVCANDEELREQIADMKRWNEENGHRFIGIDPGFNEALKAGLISAGLAEYVH